MELKVSRAILFSICLGCIIVVSALTTLYGDDFIYGTYFLNGFGNFLKLNIDHFKGTNGRAFVHLVLQCVLAFRDSLFFVALPALVCGAFSTFHKAFLEEKDKINPTTFLIFSISGVMLLSVTVLREGLFWMSGAMNYIFPLIFSYAVFYLVRKADEGNCNRYYFLTAFLAGATTEQGGAMSFAVAVLYIIYCRFIDKKNVNRRVYFIAATVFAGYITIFLSPATMSRFFVEAVGEKISLADRFVHMFTRCFGEGGALWLFAVTELLMLFELGKENRKLIMSGLALLCVAVTVICFWSRTAGGYILAVVILLTAVAMMIKKCSPMMAIAVISGGASLVMLACSTSFGYRNLVPMYFTMIAVSSAIIIKYISKQKYFTEIVAGTLLVSIAVMFFMPVIIGYAKNREIINKNLQTIEMSGDEERVMYDVGMNKSYAYVQFFELNGFYSQGFAEIYGIPEDKEIRLCGGDFRSLVYNGIECKPAYKKDGRLYYPMRDVLEADGWEVKFEKGNTVITKGEKKVYFKNKSVDFIYGDEALDATTMKLEDENLEAYLKRNTYFSGIVFEEVFGIELE